MKYDKKAFKKAVYVYVICSLLWGILIGVFIGGSIVYKNNVSKDMKCPSADELFPEYCPQNCWCQVYGPEKKLGIMCDFPVIKEGKV